tara:strand:+ start:1880 stop:2059 length:180 start_codon:yes stop_codon:yes gene_type:complete
VTRTARITIQRPGNHPRTFTAPVLHREGMSATEATVEVFRAMRHRGCQRSWLIFFEIID